MTEPRTEPSGQLWIREAAVLSGLDRESRDALADLPVTAIGKGTILFHPGDSARGFIILLDGRIEVFLTGPNGREILLYPVEPGSSCVQTTLGLLGGEDYSGEAIAVTDLRAVIIPKERFLALMAGSAPFRSFVFSAFAQRMQSMMQVLERVAFLRIEARLAEALLSRAEGDLVRSTHQELATAIGSAREVISRRLETFARQGLVTTERGAVRITDIAALRRLATGVD
ncbi:Crp/Fnr family transcriptional regulator [Frigidibacter sp. RF13]|uniref:Crp/Fnr family transcriptional regulator n=1 Tax=Frigidibacter sp. RF13 TaxID=2997340 RepID=UPI00227081AF|nr:Crp/Fnr family transcriptional regulator [Frigidibacter sp. RF13]MCY1127897.1 Crp/Fnr family transcriptional regulator [Frigidibacter sp. RF13]